MGNAQLNPDSVGSGKVRDGSLKAKDFADGQHNPATAWRAFYRNNGGAPAAFKVMAVCSPIG